MTFLVASRRYPDGHSDEAEIEASSSLFLTATTPSALSLLDPLKLWNEYAVSDF
jgi:hypothetical protein